mmetsp:Transcript_18659/g.50114  ORF Transcript_18659/g.50114 Transcript_18659/m.50114 type:complete len:217 (+) Transcript_18659:1111-1761(+)
MVAETDRRTAVRVALDMTTFALPDIFGDRGLGEVAAVLRGASVETRRSGEVRGACGTRLLVTASGMVPTVLSSGTSSKPPAPRLSELSNGTSSSAGKLSDCLPSVIWRQVSSTVWILSLRLDARSIPAATACSNASNRLAMGDSQLQFSKSTGHPLSPTGRLQSWDKRAVDVGVSTDITSLMSGRVQPVSSERVPWSDMRQGDSAASFSLMSEISR